MTIFIINVGCEYAKHSLPIMEKFCNYNNINLFILDRNIEQNIYNKHPSWLKLFCHDLVCDDFILCWDLDLIPIKKYKLDFLDVCKINLAHDSCHLKENFIFNGKFKYNCGLMGIPKSYSNFFKDIYFKHAANSSYPSYEQYYVNDSIHDSKIEINLIDNKYNYLYDGNDSPDYIQNIHYTWKIRSNEHRKKLIEDHYNKYYEKF